MLRAEVAQTPSEALALVPTQSARCRDSAASALRCTHGGLGSALPPTPSEAAAAAAQPQQPGKAFVKVGRGPVHPCLGMDLTCRLAVCRLRSGAPGWLESDAWLLLLCFTSGIYTAKGTVSGEHCGMGFMKVH